MPSRLRLTCAVAATAAVAQSCQMYFSMLGHGHAFIRIVGWHLLVNGIWVVLAPFVLAFGGRAAKTSRTPMLYLKALVLAQAVTLFHIAASTVLTLAVQPWTPVVSYSVGGAVRASFVYLYPVDLLMCGVLMAGGYAAAMSNLEIEVARANLEALRLEIRPHFMFNTLNSIAALIRVPDNERALNMLLGLSDLLRTSIEHPRRGLVSLNEEITFLRQYVAIQQMRFADRVTVAYDIDGDSAPLGIPMLLLQPLVENAYRHGATTETDRVAIQVIARVDGGRIVVSVVDDGTGPPDGFDLEADAGAGLRNVRSRLLQTYGDGGRLSIRRRTPHGTVAEIVIPAHTPLNSPWGLATS